MSTSAGRSVASMSSCDKAASNRPRSRARMFMKVATLRFLPGQRHSLGRRPEVFQSVVVPRFAVKQVNHDRSIVEQNPAAVAIALDAHAVIAKLTFEDAVDLFADGVQLAAAVAR